MWWRCVPTQGSAFRAALGNRTIGGANPVGVVSWCDNMNTEWDGTTMIAVEVQTQPVPGWLGRGDDITQGSAVGTTLGFGTAPRWGTNAMRWSRYPNYKSSGVEWLGEVPAHWAVKRGRFCMDVNPRSNRLCSLQPEDEVSFVPMEAVGEYGGLRLEQTRAVGDVGSGYTEFDNADVVVAKITPCFENGKGALALGLVNGAAFGTTELHVLRAASTLDPRLLFYLTTSRWFRSTGEGQMYGAGGQKRVPPEFCKNALIPLPPMGEQRAIADFLDRETAKLDTLVTKKRTLIERLKEKRTALISRTVTRGLPPDAARAAGLDPHPKLKPSGIDWLGDVPEHWVVKRFRHLLRRLDQGWSPVAAGWPATDDEWGVLKLSAARDGRFIPEENKALEDDFDGSGQATPQAGDILISRSNTPDRVGDVALVLGDRPLLLIPDLLYRAQIDTHSMSPAFVCLFLLSKSARVQIEADARGSSGSMVKLGQSHVRDWFVPCPPLAEQCAVADFLAARQRELTTWSPKSKPPSTACRNTAPR